MKATKSNFADLMAIARQKEAEREANLPESPITQTRLVAQTSLVEDLG